ncbi:SpaA isopeptide-forming pilin-related protein [Gordonibacter pamelaeae]|nr:SpaA isopeptide-forming pilin-related protein [Gordonibacter pamelaeae]
MGIGKLERTRRAPHGRAAVRPALLAAPRLLLAALVVLACCLPAGWAPRAAAGEESAPAAAAADEGASGAEGDEPGTAPGSPDGGVPQEDAGGLDEDALSSGADGAAPEPPSDNAAAPEPAVGSEQHGEEDRVAGAALYVSSAGSDADGDGTREKPLATLAQAVQRADAGSQAQIVVMDDLQAAATAVVGGKDVVVRGEPDASGAAPTVVAGAADVFSVATGSLKLEGIVIDGASVPADHRVATVTGEGGSLTLGLGATVRNWSAVGTAGAVRVRANGGSFTMLDGSAIRDCRLKASAAGAGGAAASVSAARSSGASTVPSASYRASFAMEEGASIVGCTTTMTANATFSGGGAVRATDADVSVGKGASISGCSLEYRAASGALIDAVGTVQGGGALFANNCKVDLAGSVDDCHMVSAENTGTGDFFSGGGALFVYDYGCTTAVGVDCRTSVSGTVTGCTALAGGGAFYWSQADGYDQGDNLWVGPSGPLTSADQVVARVLDAFTVSGTFSECSTYDVNNRRTASLTSYADYERYGIGGGAVCGAYTGLVVLDGGALLQSCSTGSEGGGVSSWGTSVFCLDRTADGRGVPAVLGCSSGGIAGGVSAGASAHIENVTVKDCKAGTLGGGLYIYSGSTTLYDCDVSGCTAGTYGGGIMQHVVHDLFMYGGSVTGNHAGTGGGGIALVGHWGGTPSAPRGLSFNYPASLNGGYTNPVYYKTAILQDKIVAPSVVAGNTQASSKASDIWTPPSSPVTRIAASGGFLPGSKVGVTVSDGSSAYNKARTQFGSASQPNLDLSPFASDVDATLVASYSGSTLRWVEGFTVSYDANVPAGATLEGKPPFDGVAGIPSAYARSGGTATVQGAGTLAARGYRFVGWSPVASSEEAPYTPGDLLAYSAALDADGDGRIVLYAVWEKAPVRADVSFVKVGADQEAGTRMPLAGARFNVYRYVGDVELGPDTVNGGSIDLASPGSAQWAAVMGPSGEEGQPGGLDEPYAFVSSDGSEPGAPAGTVTLAGLSPDAWYMLVEASAPAGYQLPTGQWAFRVVESPEGSGSYAIDASTLLARQGSDGSLPPAFASSIQTAEGAREGLFLPNVPVFELPRTGTAPWRLLLAAAGALMAAVGIALGSRARRSRA